MHSRHISTWCLDEAGHDKDEVSRQVTIKLRTQMLM